MQHNLRAISLEQMTKHVGVANISDHHGIMSRRTALQFQREFVQSGLGYIEQKELFRRKPHQSTSERGANESACASNENALTLECRRKILLAACVPLPVCNRMTIVLTTDCHALRF